ncbi:phosphotyrosine protein phosphatase [Parashewanella tropica]|uniref:phosphotyrosine protein phosphatase n=1 Tax=Parashewanella tropica TaxID=2547970 RepID=UPI0010592F07|nr:phosphotyrosine protein phosphatase [Parashewanella tropica]
MKKILFLCTANIQRSKTAEVYFTETKPNNTYKSAGLSFKLCEKYNSQICSEEMLDWADIVFVMEPEHIKRIQQYTNDKYLHKIINLEIEDKYQFMSDSLVAELDRKVSCFL